MNLRSSLAQLLAVSAGLVAVALVGRATSWVTKDLTLILIISIGFFCALTCLSLWLVSRSLRSGKPFQFVNAVVINFMMRLGLSAILLVALAKAMSPRLEELLIPFASCYILFTVLESIWLMRLNKETPRKA